MKLDENTKRQIDDFFDRIGEDELYSMLVEKYGLKPDDHDFQWETSSGQYFPEICGKYDNIGYSGNNNFSIDKTATKGLQLAA